MPTESSHPLPFANLPPHHQHFVFIRHSSPYPICYNFFYQMYTLSNSACTFHYTYHPPALALLPWQSLSHQLASPATATHPPCCSLAMLHCQLLLHRQGASQEIASKKKHTHKKRSNNTTHNTSTTTTEKRTQIRRSISSASIPYKSAGKK